MNVNTSAPRHLRSYLIRTLDGVNRKLYLLSPKQAGCKMWRFAIHYNDEFVLIGKPVTKDVGVREGVTRYGHKASQVVGNSLPKPKAPKVAKPRTNHAQRLATTLAGVEEAA